MSCTARRRAWLLLLPAAAPACSGLTDSGGGVIAIEIRAPSASPTIEVGDTLQLSARALDRNGDSIAAPLSWRTADTTITVDAATGRVVGVTPGAIGRVQVVAGTLASDPISINVVSRPDSVIAVGPTALVVPLGGTESAPLQAELTTNLPAGPLAGRTLIFTVVDPVFASVAGRTVELPNAQLADTATTGGDGLPTVPIVLRRVVGVAQPATATVEVRASRRSGAPVPGSGQRFVVTFQ